MSKYLTTRAGIFYYRRRIPADCTDAFFKKRELTLSLDNTTSRQQALILAEHYNVLYNQLFLQIRKHLMDKFNFNRIFGFGVQTKTHSDGSKETTCTIDADDILAWKKIGLSNTAIEGLLHRAISDSPTLPSTRESEPVPVHQGATETKSQACASSLTLSATIAEFNRDRAARRHNSENWSPSSVETTKFRRLLEILGPDTSLHAIGRAEAKSVRDLINQLPKNSEKFRGLSLIDAIAAARSANADYERISTKQFNDHMGLFLSLFKWAINENHYGSAVNPFNALKKNEIKTIKRNQLRDRFSRKEIQTIFSHVIFTDFEKAFQSNPKLRPYRYWTPLIGLYSGARPCEIGGLYLCDIYCVKDVWVFDFNHNSADKCSKTGNAVRRTPIHPELIELGLLDYVNGLKLLGKKRLFPELSHEDKDGYARYINERFSETILKE
ncbi:MAG: hypothetical protein C0631_14025 [Sedimenticola sp.]|nr:MAG: hypothetical protein C0631_14025 [Sedimenticola sp.]